MFTRPLASVTAVALVSLGLLALLPDCASACSCALVGSQQERAKQALSDSTAVFSGEVVAVEKEAATAYHPGTSKITLRVSEAWKGPAQETLEVSTPSQGSACGYPFKEGQEYLVYAYGKEEPFEVDLCSGTKQLSDADADLRVLGEGWSSGEDSLLSDTSGGFPRLEIVGVLGLAVAAVSLVVLMRLVRTS